MQISLRETKIENGPGRDDGMVYDLVLTDANCPVARIEIPCVTERDALALLDKLKAAIEAHTNENVVIQ